VAVADGLKPRRPLVPLAWLLLVSHVGVFALPLLWLIGTGALAADQGRQREKELLRRDGAVVGALLTIHANRDGAELAQDLGTELGVAGLFGIVVIIGGAA
jgi:hypothetical protein